MYIHDQRWSKGENKMKCCICKKEFEGFGNNPFPIAGAKCCDLCNSKIVIPLRLFYHSLDKQNVALLIKEKELELIKPKNKYFTLKELQNAVSGHIELIGSKIPRYLVVCNEEGLLKELYWNDLAHLIFDYELVGNVLVCPEIIFEKPEDNDE